jgi:transcription termination factor Rho
MSMTETLERSVLEGKDRDQLVTIAGALGLKPAARASKTTIIDKILETTSGGDAPAAKPAKAAKAAKTAKAPAKKAGKKAAATDESPELTFEDAGSDSGESDDGGSYTMPEPKASKADVVVHMGPDGEPLADWEVELMNSGDVPASSSAETRNGLQGRDRGDRPDRPERGPRPNDGGRTVVQAGQGAPSGGEPQGAEDGEGREGRRRRRRNRNRNREGGPQGDDRFEADAPVSTYVAPQRDRSQNDRSQNDRSQNDRSQNDRSQNDRSPQGGDNEVYSNVPVEVSGYLDLRDEGYGFLRVNGFLASKDDCYVAVKQSKQYGLRKGDFVTGTARPAGRQEKNPALLTIETINGLDPEKARVRPRFEDLTPLFPDKRLTLENPADPTNMTARIIDLICPIGKGQRGIIVSPPKAGKTTVMKTIAQAIERNHPEVTLMVLLIDERPEEVTDFRRSVKGEVIASTFDRPSDEHTHIAELTIEKAKRLVEAGGDVVIILDGITRLSRAYNLAAPTTGRIMSGGIDAGALYPPKKFFGAARNIEEGGSLTILATALVDTNSRMDDAIFEEFKGTGNMELRLDRKISERRIYPAIDVDGSSTRHEELLYDRKQLQMVWKLRRVLSGLASDGGSGAAGLELLIDRLKSFRTNDEFLNEIAKQPN